MWLRQPVWMLRYWISSFAISFALAAMPNRTYARDLRRRIHEFRNEATTSVLAQRIMREAEKFKAER